MKKRIAGRKGGAFPHCSAAEPQAEIEWWADRTLDIGLWTES